MAKLGSFVRFWQQCFSKSSPQIGQLLGLFLNVVFFKKKTLWPYFGQLLVKMGNFLFPHPVTLSKERNQGESIPQKFGRLCSVTSLAFSNTIDCVQNCKILICVFLKMDHSWYLFLHFSLFNTFDRKCFADDCI